MVDASVGEISEMFLKSPIVVILGSTGTGKSKLAIELAQRFTGEIISADSMQVYKGLDVVTNKVTHEERAQVRHHLIDFLDPMKAFTVVDFRNRVLDVISHVTARQKLPIIVGGTNYYIESVLWHVLICSVMSPDTLISDLDPSPGVHASRKRPGSPRHASSATCLDLDPTGEELETRLKSQGDEAEDVPYRNKIKGVSNEELHEELTKVDPEMAVRLHPNDRRKIIRSLEVFKSTGETHSSLLEKQRNMEGGGGLGGALRFRNSVVLWLRCEAAVLDQRLNQRVDEMISRGLLKELSDFHEEYNQQRLSEGKPPDYTSGIFQSIGFKEFHRYLVKNQEERDSEEGQKLLSECMQEFMLATKRYARRQIKWVKSRFLGRQDRQVPPVYGLDTTDLETWKEKVSDVAADVVDCFLRGVKPPIEALPIETGIAYDYEKRVCDVCDRIFIGTRQWTEHQQSMKHERLLKKKRLENEAKLAKLAEIAAMLEAAAKDQAEGENLERISNAQAGS